MRRLGTVLLAIALALAACGNDEPTPTPPPDGPTTFKVMTQNLYLGGELFLAFTEPDLTDAVELIWSSVKATDFRERAKVIADSIQAEKPDLVGLQEVSLWRTQTPGDGFFIIPNATAVAYDILDILLGELGARGLSYRVVASVQNADVEVPGSSGTEYRLTDRDVVLANESLPIVSTASGIYPHLAIITVPSPIGDIPAIIPRGWVSVEFRAGGKTIRAVNTHLEAFSEEVAAQQAIDLIGIASPGTQPTIVLGDMNLAPGSAGYGTFLAGTGLSDTWADLNEADPGLTCCWNPDLKSGAFTTRIDLVFATASPSSTSAVKVNETEQTPTGLAPSDHAGVVVGFTAATSATMPLASR
jgi:endonuclease/exonuclease/phosphatase family metal-dependent hydrolase